MTSVTSEDGVLAPRKLASLFARLRTPGMTILSIAFFLGIWQFSSTFLVNSYLIPPPTEVVYASIPMFKSGEIFAHIRISMSRILVGFFLGSTIAIVIGVIMGRIRLLSEIMDPIIEIVRYLSPTAMIPIAVIWFGIGESSKYFLIFWGTFFFVLINTITGIISVPTTRQRACRCLGANELQILVYVVIPSALPYILTGMRVAMAASFMSLIPAEMLASNSGLGYLLQASALMVRTDRIFVALAVICILGFLTDRVFRMLIKYFLSTRFPVDAMPARPD